MNGGHMIVRSKLVVPSLPPGQVGRDRLFDRIEPPKPVTLFCAPAGFGKTSAAVAWLARRDMPLAWLSLDRRDNDAARFLIHLAAAVQTAIPGCGKTISEAADILRDRDVPVLAERFVNELYELAQPFALVLDDYHVIAEQKVHDAMAVLLERLPPAMHLVILSRQEPVLPLARCRMRGQFAELREGDLRFTRGETEQFLNGTMQLGLSSAQIDRVDERSEGWVGGLQLAALSLSGRADRDAFLRSFAGNDRYIMDYLAAEVLAAQSPETRRFLLRTSILDRMNADICGAVTGLDNCGSILERLERDHVFVVALDQKREWYRYHHLFADLLRHQLALSREERASDCHRAASIWHEAQGAIAEAVDHALAAGDTERVADLAASHAWDLILGGHSKQLLSWLMQVPERILLDCPKRLSAALWCEYIRLGQFRQVWRERIEVMAKAGATPEDEAILAELAMLDVFEMARDSRRFREAIALASRIENDPVAGNRPCVKVCAPAVLAGCSHACGDVGAAGRAYETAVRAALDYRSVSMFFISSLGHARLRAAVAGPREGLRRIEAARASAAHMGWDGLPFMSWLAYGAGEMLYEQNDLKAAAQAFEEAIALARYEPSTVRHIARIGLARLRLAEGRAGEVDDLTQEVGRVAYVRPLMPVLPDLDVETARLALIKGMTGEAEAFIRQRGLHQQAMRTDATDAEVLLASEWLIRRHRHGEAIEILTERLAHAETAGRLDTAIRTRLVLALARFLNGEWRQALEQIDVVLTRAMSLGYRRIFLDGPPSLTSLIERLLEEMDDPRTRRFVETLLAEREGGKDDPPLPEPLSPGERRVLQLVTAGLSNKEIGKRLFISQNTVKTHLRHIFAKTGARNRAEAIRYAHANDLAVTADHPLDHPNGR